MSMIKNPSVGRLQLYCSLPQMRSLYGIKDGDYMLFILKCLMTAINIIMILVYLYASGENQTQYSATGSLFIELTFICNTILIWR